MPARLKVLLGGGGGENILAFGIEHRERDVLLSRAGDVAVYFVRKHEDSVVEAYLRNAAQFVFPPYASRRIVGIAQEKHLRARVFRLALDVGVIEGEISVGVDERGIKRRAPELFHACVERHIRRRIYDYAVAFRRKALHGGFHCRYDAGTEHDFVKVEFVSVVSFQIIHHGYIVVRGERHTVSEYLSVYPGFHRFAYGFGNGEIHIRNPHRDKIRGKQGIEHGGGVVFDGIRPLAPDYLVEVVHARGRRRGSGVRFSRTAGDACESVENFFHHFGSEHVGQKFCAFCEREILRHADERMRGEPRHEPVYERDERGVFQKFANFAVDGKCHGIFLLVSGRCSQAPLSSRRRVLRQTVRMPPRRPREGMCV